VAAGIVQEIAKWVAHSSDEVVAPKVDYGVEIVDKSLTETRAIKQELQGGRDVGQNQAFIGKRRSIVVCESAAEFVPEGGEQL
jgi:hypothetical protein